MSITVKQILTIVLCLPGALLVGYAGSMVAKWGALLEPHPSEFAAWCWFFWGGFGGASLGATPGLLLGYYYNMKCACPFLGAALGALVSLFFTYFGHSPISARIIGIIDNGPLLAGLVLLGFIYAAIRTLTSLKRRTALIAVSVLGATYFLVLVLFVALRPVSVERIWSPQPIEAGKPLSLTSRVIEANDWARNFHFGLAPGAPPGAKIDPLDPREGRFSWTPPLEQPAGKYDVTVLVSADGQRSGQTTFAIMVTRPTPPVEGNRR